MSTEMSKFDGSKYLHIDPIDLWPKRMTFGHIGARELMATMRSNPNYKLVGDYAMHWNEKDEYFYYNDIELIWEKEATK